MARITQKEIINHFYATFDDGTVMTQSEKNQNYKMQAFKLKNLRKSVKTYIEEAKIETDKSVDQIIMDAITYAGMTGCKFKSIASIGYDVLPKSIDYWKRIEYKVKKAEEEKEQKEKEKSIASELDKKVEENNKKLANTHKVPSWYNLEE